MNSRPLLSICIPTYNRADILQNTLDSIIASKSFSETNDVEIVISDNCSTDHTEQICREIKEKYGDKIIYIRRDEPIFPDYNIFQTIDYANGIYCKINNDTCSWNEGMVDEALEMLKNNLDFDCVLFLGNFKLTDERLIPCKTMSQIVKEMTIFFTSTNIFCIKKETYNELDDPLRYAKKRFPLADITGRLCEKDKNILIYNAPSFSAFSPYKKGGKYNVSEAFGHDYLWILSNFIDKHNGLSKEVFEIEKKNIMNHVNHFYFDLAKEHTFQKTGYLKNMKTFFGGNSYFWKSYIEYFIKDKIFYFNKRIDGCHALLKIFGHNFVIERNFKKLWRKKNRHNETELVKNDLFDSIYVDWHAKGKIDVYGDKRFNRGILRIGKFTTISDGVKFYLTPTPKKHKFSTFNDENEFYNLKNITIKDDVWIGQDVKILAGVTIGQGAVIGAGSIVSEDIPPYAIVDKNEIVDYRYSEDIIEELLKVDFNKLEKFTPKVLKQYVNKDNVRDIIKEINE